MPNNPNFDRIGIVLCLRGSRQLLINGNAYTQSQGMVLILSPLFVINEVDVTPDYEERFISAEPHVVFSLLSRLSRIVVAIRIINNPCFQANQQLLDFLESNAHRISDYENKRDDSSNSEEVSIYNIMIEKIVEECILNVAMFLYQHTDGVRDRETANENILFDFVMQLQRGVARNRNVAYYAENAKLSVGYFSSVIRKTAGVSPSRLISAFTIAHAKTLLSKTKKSIKEIATEMNFPEQYTFRKYFKQYTGMSPTAYRKCEDRQSSTVSPANT